MKQALANMLQMQHDMNTRVHENWIAQNFEWYRAAWIECGELIEHYEYKSLKKLHAKAAFKRVYMTDNRGVMHAQSHDSDYAVRRELQHAFYFTRAGMGLVFEKRPKPWPSTVCGHGVSHPLVSGILCLRQVLISTVSTAPT